MKKSVVIVAAIIVITVLTLMLAGCNPLDEKPEDTSLGYWIKQDVKGEEDLGHRLPPEEFGSTETYLAKEYEPRYCDIHGYVIGLPEEYVVYKVGAYPDLSDGGRFITGIEITDRSVSVFGITVESSGADFESVFKDMGCEVSVENRANGDKVMSAEKGDVTISLTNPAEGRRYIKISVEVTNKTGIVY